MDPFELVPIGATGLRITRLGLGGVFVGGRDSSDGVVSGYETALATLGRAYELGVRYFDTAPFYGQGRSEVRFGRALRKFPRNSYTLSTKVGRRLKESADDPGRWEEDELPHLEAYFDMSRDGIFRAVEESLERHQLDQAEILYLHDPDRGNFEREALDTAFPAMLELKSQGLVKAIGTGMNQWEMPYRFLQNVDLDVILLAGRYTLLDQSAYAEFLPLCLARGARVVTGGPYNSGILAAKDLDGPVWFNYQNAPREWVDKARAIKAICERNGTDLRAAALQFPLAHPAVACVIPGAANPTQIEENVELIRALVPIEVWRELKDAGLIPADAPTPQ